MILALVLFWGVMLITMIVATLISVIRHKKPAQESKNHWQPARAYAWDATR